MPLILIHGIQEGPEIWNDFLLNGGLDLTKFKPYYFTYETKIKELTQSDPTTISALGKLLGTSIDSDIISGELNGRPVIFLAHSMGGLVVRWMMENYYFQDHSPGGDKTALLITLATPHHGTPIANDYFLVFANPTALDLFGFSFFNDANYFLYGLQPNFAFDLSWDCYNEDTYGYCQQGLFPSQTGYSQDRYDDKIVAIGAGTTSIPLNIYLPSWDLLSNEGYFNDGAVPIQSALFDGATIQARYQVDGNCDHSGIYTHSYTISSVSGSPSASHVPIFNVVQNQLLGVALANPIPVVTGISPRSFSGTSQAVALTIMGNGFTPNSTLTFNDGVDPPFSGRVPTFVSQNELTYNVTVGTQAAMWLVSVVDGTLSSSPYSFFVLNGNNTTSPATPILTSPTTMASRNNLFNLSWDNPSDPTGIARVWLKIGSAPTSPTDGTAFPLPLYNPLPVSLPTTQGAETVYIWLEDAAGNKSQLNTASAVLTLDITPPLVTIATPASETYSTSQSTISISGTYSDNLSGVTAMVWTDNQSGGGGVVTNTGGTLEGSWTSMINLASGTNNLSIIAVDAAGNVGVANTQVIYLNGSNTGALNIGIAPAAALSAGGQWQIAGETAWRNAGIATNIAVGNQQIQFKPLNGWTTPPTATVNVQAGLTAPYTGTYTSADSNQPPGPVANPSPANGAGGVGRANPLFTFTRGSLQDVLDFDFFLGTNSNPQVNPIEEWPYGTVFGESIQLSRTLNAATTYYWQVNSRDENSGLETDGPIWSFTTEYAYPDLAVTSLSLAGTVAPGGNVTISASAANLGTFTADVENVYFYLSRSPGAKEIRLNLPNSLWLNPPLVPGQSTNINFVATLNGLQAGQSFIDASIEPFPGAVVTDPNLGNNIMSIPISYVDTTPPQVTSVSLDSPYGLKTGLTNYIIYFATDNIGVVSLDFLYSTNGGLNWTPIQEGYVPLFAPTYGANYPWLIPTNFPITTNLEIQVVAWDTSGNSGMGTAGPYTVLDGTLPSVTVVSPTDGDVWNMGSVQEIQWIVSSANPIASVDIEFFYGGIDYGDIAFPTPSPDSTNFQWTLPSNFSTTEGQILVEVTDINGNQAQGWSTGYFTVHDTSAPPPAPWSTTAQLTSITNSDTITDVKLAVDNSGNVHLAYIEEADSVTTSPRIITQTVHYKQRTAQTWPSNDQIVYSITQQTDSELTGFYSLDSLKIAVSDQGTPHIVWVQDYTSGSLTNRNQNDIYYTFNNGLSWSTPTNISTGLQQFPGTNTVSELPSIAVDHSNNVYVAWTDGFIWNADSSTTGNDDLFLRKKDAVSGWEIPMELISDYGYWPSVCVTTNNEIMIAYVASGQIPALIQQNSSGWSSPTMLPYRAGDSIQIVASAFGTYHLFFGWYNTSAGVRQNQYAYFNGTTWSSSNIVAAGPSYLDFALNADSLDRPHVVFQDIDFPGDVLYSFQEDGSWAPPLQLNLSSQHVMGVGDAAMFSPSNELSVVWVSSVNGAYQVLYNHAFVGSTNDVFPPSVSVRTPSTGEVLPIYSSFNIQWHAVDNIAVTSVNLDYSTNNGASWISIATNQSNTGLYPWIVPNSGTNAGEIRVTAFDAAGNAGYGYSGSFITANLTPPTIVIISPTNGATLTGNAVVPVLWDASDNVAVTNVYLEYSLNNGSTWLALTNDPSNSGFFSWLVPNSATTNLLLRATAKDSAGFTAVAVTAQPLSIIRENNPPITPFNPFPLAGGINVPFTAPVLKWQSGDEDGDPLTYQIKLGTNAIPSTTLTLTQPSFTPGFLAPQTTYYWQVLVSDGIATTPGPVWTFTTQSGPRPQAVLSGQTVMTNSAFQFQFAGIFRQTYALQASTNLLNWVTISNVLVTATPMLALDPNAMNYNLRFYRLVDQIGGPSIYISGFQRSTNQMSQFDVNGGLGQTYTIQVSGDLINWTNLANVTLTNSPVPFSDFSSTNVTRRFYRLISQ